MKTRIYIAGPMTLGDKIDHLANAMRVFRALLYGGYAPMLPQLTFFLEPFMKAEHADWLGIDLPWVTVAQAVLRLPGESKGADMEVECAKRAFVPVYFNLRTLLREVSPETENGVKVVGV